MKGKMTIVGVDGSFTENVVVKTPSLNELQKAVGGYIELVPMFDTYRNEPCVVFCNEEGKLEGLKFNTEATKLWMLSNAVHGGNRRRQTFWAAGFSDILVGDIVILTGDKEFMESL